MSTNLFTQNEKNLANTINLNLEVHYKLFYNPVVEIEEDIIDELNVMINDEFAKFSLILNKYAQSNYSHDPKSHDRFFKKSYELLNEIESLINEETNFVAFGCLIRIMNELESISVSLENKLFIEELANSICERIEEIIAIEYEVKSHNLYNAIFAYICNRLIKHKYFGYDYFLETINHYFDDKVDLKDQLFDCLLEAKSSSYLLKSKALNLIKSKKHFDQFKTLCMNHLDVACLRKILLNELDDLEKILVLKTILAYNDEEYDYYYQELKVLLEKYDRLDELN